MNVESKFGSLVLATFLALGGFAACSGTELGSSPVSKEAAANTVGLELQPVAGVTINTVHYVVTAGGMTNPVLEGDLPTPGSGTTFNAGLPVPVGVGYTLSLSAISAESTAISCTGSAGPFNVLPNQSTRLSIELTCIDARNGAVNDVVAVSTDACPRLIVDYVAVTPSTGNVNGEVQVFAQAHDLDGKPVTYAWHSADASVVSFAANAANTRLTCLSSATDLALTLTANNGQCSKSLSTRVSCGGTCGNGSHDPDEQCDPSAGDALCKPNCTFAVCGNGVVEAPSEQCDPFPPDPSHCSSTCQILGACGDGVLTPPEQCDGTLFPPGTLPGSMCSATCQIMPIIEGPCGDGIKGPGELCDPGFTVNDCGRDCKSITPAACLACEQSNECSDFVDCFQAVGNAAAGSPAAGTPKAYLCNAVLDCVRDSGCAEGGNSIIKCYCGTANATGCQNGLGNGACKAEIERSLETVTFAQIVQRLKNPSYGGGVALARVDCEQQLCKQECGLN